MEAKGTFDVKVSPADSTAFEKGMGVARYELDKIWLGGFAGVSKGEMLASSTASTGSMAYVAMEQMTGKLDGKSGSFFLAHRATMTRGGLRGDARRRGEGIGDRGACRYSW